MFDDDGYYVCLPDPETLPEPYFANMTWEQIKGELLRLEQQAWEEQAMNEMWYQENRTWFHDY